MIPRDRAADWQGKYTPTCPVCQGRHGEAGAKTRAFLPDSGRRARTQTAFSHILHKTEAGITAAAIPAKVFSLRPLSTGQRTTRSGSVPRRRARQGHSAAYGGAKAPVFCRDRTWQAAAGAL